MRKHQAISLFAMLAALALSACKPDYPACDTDKDCKAKEFCVERKCQQCRNDGDCGEGQSCQAGKCGAIPNWCASKSDCQAGEECIANRCRACAADGECPSGTICLAGQCKPPQCKTDDDCSQAEDCVNGRCVGDPSAGKAPCLLEPVYFDFDQATLSSEATQAIVRNAECLKKANRPVNLIGRADPRGTTEYNLALSDRRAQSVIEYLRRLGINPARLKNVPRGALDATGTDEASWARDRRVDGEWQ